MTDVTPTTWSEFQTASWLRARREGIPLSGTFELTPLCNFQCRMCYVRVDALPEGSRLRTAEEWLDLARQAAEGGMYAVTLTGGEPLTHPEFTKIYRALSEMGLLVSVLSNGSLINDDAISLFHEFPPTNLRITLYGASNETYERLCGVHDGFDRVMSSLRALANARVPFSLAFTRTRLNEKDEDAVRRIAQALGVPLGVTSDLVPAVRGAASDARELRIPRAERLDGIDPDDACDTSVKAAPSPAALPPDVLEGPFSNCSAYRTAFFVSWDGLMEGCSLMSSVHLRPFEVGFDAAWEGLLAKLGNIRTPERCLSCDLAPYCTACPGRRNAETGDPEGIPETRCREARALRERLSELEAAANVEVN